MSYRVEHDQLNGFIVVRLDSDGKRALAYPTGNPQLTSYGTGRVIADPNGNPLPFPSREAAQVALDAHMEALDEPRRDGTHRVICLLDGVPCFYGTLRSCKAIAQGYTDRLRVEPNTAS